MKKLSGESRQSGILLTVLVNTAPETTVPRILTDSVNTAPDTTVGDPDSPGSSWLTVLDPPDNPRPGFIKHVKRQNVECEWALFICLVILAYLDTQEKVCSQTSVSTWNAHNIISHYHSL